MNKSLLVILSLSIGISSYAQNGRLLEVAKISKPVFSAAIDPETTTGPLAATNKLKEKNLTVNSNRAASTVTKTKFASSANLFSVLVSDQQALTADPALNLIMFTARQNYTNTAGNSGYVQSSVSLNRGQSWDSTLIVYNGDVDLGRYPSGGILNPTGNTNPLQAYSVVSGPITGGSGWVGNYFASRRLDGANQDQKIQLNDNTGVTFQHMARVSFTTTPLQKAYVLGVDFDYNNTASSEFNGAILNTGTFNPVSNNIDWATQKINPDFALDPSDNSKLVYDFGNMAWSKDGYTGYIVFLGREAVNDFNYPMPIVYKSIDAGLTWNKMPAFNFSNLETITKELIPVGDVQGNPAHPYFTSSQGLDLAVDINNNLHILSMIYSAASEDPAELGMVYVNYRPVFDVFTTSSGGWNAIKVTELMTAEVPAASSPWAYEGGIGWDARLQISRSDGGSRMFYVWMDTDTRIFNDETINIYPDIFSKGYDVVTGYQTPAKNFTANSPYEGSNFWMFASDKSFSDGTKYVIPVTTTRSKDDGDDGLGPALHEYVSGIQFDQSEFVPVGVEEIFKEHKLTVSQNIPNPFKGNTQIELNLSEASLITLDITNTLGQSVFNHSYGKLSLGVHSLKIDAAQFNHGIYFYSVTAGNQKITKKMIVN